MHLFNALGYKVSQIIQDGESVMRIFIIPTWESKNQFPEVLRLQFYF